MKRNRTLKVTIEWNKETGEERNLEVTYNYYPGTMYSYESMEPPDCPGVGVVSVIMLSPTFYNREATEDVWDSLNDKEKYRIIEKCLEAETNSREDYSDY